MQINTKNLDSSLKSPTTARVIKNPSLANPLEILRALVARVSRAFYEPPYIAILDVLSRNPSVKDVDIANYLKISTKQLRPFIDRLKEGKLIKQEARQEIRMDGKTHHRLWYYIDYKQFVDVVKYKLAMMDRKLQKEFNDADQQHGYECTSCKTFYEPWEAIRLKMDMKKDGVFICERCNGELSEKVNVSAGNMKELARLFSKQSEPILELYRQTDRMIIPEYKPMEKMEIKKDEFGELAIAKGGEIEESKIEVEFNNDVKIESNKEEIRKQNVLPIWHQVSTITGKRYDEGLTSPTKSPFSPIRRDSSTSILYDKQDDKSEIEEEEDDTAKIVADYYASLKNQPIVPEDEVVLSDDDFVEVGIKREREEEDDFVVKKVKLDSDDDEDFVDV